MNITVCMPIHNEQQFLTRSLNSFNNAPIQHFIGLVDNCTDKSETILHNWSLKDPPFKITILTKTTKHKWKHPIAENFEYLSEKAKTDIIYFVNADHVINKGIFNSKNWNNADLISFQMLYPPTTIKHVYENMLMKTYDAINPQSQNGLLAFKKAVWEKIHFIDSDSPSNNFITPAIKQGFKHKFINQYKNIHLHAKMTKQKQMLQGSYRALNNVSLFKTLLHSILHFEPYTINGYLQAKTSQ